MLGPLASADARQRAEEIAVKAGCKITEVRSYGIHDTGTIEKDVSVVVTVTFGIAR